MPQESNHCCPRRRNPSPQLSPHWMDRIGGGRTEMHIYERLGVRSVINARSFSTKVGGCALPHEVLDAMREASDSCVYMHELHEAASRIIAEATDAEAGMVTSGASAALTLATAAYLAGFDVTRMNRLPDTT